MAKGARLLYMPVAGVIKGGRLDGWAYHFLRFAMQPTFDADGLEVHELCPVVRVSAPNWPFPCDMALHAEHYRELESIKGTRTRNLLAGPLIEQAYTRAGLTVPAFFAEQASEARKRLVRAQQWMT